MPYGSKWPPFGVKYHLGVSNPYCQTNDFGSPNPPPPREFISTNEDSTDLITASNGENLTTN